MTFSQHAFAFQNKDEFLIEYGIYNPSKSLKLNYIHYNENETIVSISYTGLRDVGQYKEIFLENYRIVDKASRQEYYFVGANVISRKNPERHTFLENAAEPINIEIVFERLPDAVTNIDIIEADGNISETYNFSFLNLKINQLESIKDINKIKLIVDKFPKPYLAVVYTLLETEIQISVNGFSLGNLPTWEPFDFELDPDCDDLNVFTLVFPNENERSLYAKERGGGYWSLKFIPKPYGILNGCKKIKLGNGK